MNCNRIPSTTGDRRQSYLYETCYDKLVTRSLRHFLDLNDVFQLNEIEINIKVFEVKCCIIVSSNQHIGLLIPNSTNLHVLASYVVNLSLWGLPQLQGLGNIPACPAVSTLEPDLQKTSLLLYCLSEKCTLL